MILFCCILLGSTGHRTLRARRLHIETLPDSKTRNEGLPGPGVVHKVHSAVFEAQKHLHIVLCRLKHACAELLNVVKHAANTMTQTLQA